MSDMRLLAEGIKQAEPLWMWMLRLRWCVFHYHAKLAWEAIRSGLGTGGYFHPGVWRDSYESGSTPQDAFDSDRSYWSD